MWQSFYINLKIMPFMDGHYLGLHEYSGRTAMIAIKSSDMHRLVGKLAESDIITSCRDNNLRIAPHIYNNCADIERSLNALSNNRSLLA